MVVSIILKSKGTDGVFTIKPSATVAEAAAILSEKRIGSLVASEDGEIAVGILSERDIVRELGRRGVICMQETVAEMMTVKLVTCTPETPIEQVMAQMTEGRFRHMPVLGADGKMVGLVTLGDVVKARLSEVSMEKQALEGMIMGF